MNTPVTAPAVAADDPTSAPAETAPRWRSIASTICGVLAVLFLTLSLVGIWARVTVFDSSKVSDIVADALDDPTVTSGLATWVTDQVFAAVDAESTVSGILPTNLERFAPTLVAGAQSFVDQGVDRALANPDVQQALARAVERAHQALMTLLQGDGLVDGITVSDGAVTVNLLPLVGRGLSIVQGLGLFDDLEIPELTRAGDPDQQIAQLEAATGRDLPADFGQLTVFESDRLAEAQASVQNAQRMFALFKRATVLLAVLAIAFLAATALLARDRWHAALLLALGVTVGVVLSRAVVHRVLDEAPDLAAGPAGKAAISDILGAATQGLLRLNALVALLAALAAVLALFRRGWLRDDLVAVGAVVLGLSTVAILGFSIASLLIGLALGVAVAVFVPRALSSRARGAVTPTTV
jgi:hypothetical protein